jgi:alpha-beta hydrolase superfamily lysophospholipase
MGMEQTILLDRGQLQIPCKITCPDDHGVNQVVLGVHGIGGSMDDAIQTAIAEEMAMFYDAAVRFDFPAHGQNTEDTFSLPLCQQTLLEVARYAKERFPQVQDLCVFATGFGAYVTLSVLEKLLELPGQIRLVVQTPGVRMHETILSMLRLSKETFRAMDRKKLMAPRPIEITYQFYKELERNIVLTTQPIPMLILHSEQDGYIRREDIQNFRRINEGSKLVIIPGTSHQFLEEGAWDMVLDLTRDWFAFQQVLLCDWE